MIIYAIPFAIGNQTRSIVSLDWFQKERGELYFQNKPYLYNDYSRLISLVKYNKMDIVGLYMNVDDWEYPLWVLANHPNLASGGIVFRHITARNNTSKFSEPSFMPEYIVATSEIREWKHSLNYNKITDYKYLSLYKKM